MRQFREVPPLRIGLLHPVLTPPLNDPHQQSDKMKTAIALTLFFAASTGFAEGAEAKPLKSSKPNITPSLHHFSLPCANGTHCYGVALANNSLKPMWVNNLIPLYFYQQNY